MLAALLVLAAGMHARQTRLRERLARITAWEQGLHRELFPGEAVPAGVGLRFASERRRLSALTTGQPGVASAHQDALAVLRDVIASLPADLRVNIQELRVEGADITLRGNLGDHRQAEQIAAALDRVPGLQCSSPRTQRLPEGGVQFYLHAQARPPAGAPAKPRDGLTVQAQEPRS